MDTEKFWAKVQKTDTCWLWTGAVGTAGYGSYRLNGKKQGAHRISWQLVNGPIRLNILHRCDVKLCVNPEHLFEGSYSDNMQDWSRKRERKLGMEV